VGAAPIPATQLPGPDHIEGYAIVSADGMIADASGAQPAALYIEADQKFFHDGLARADAVAHGRNSYEGGSAAAQRRRLVLTRGIAGIAPHPQNAKAKLWNPAGASLHDAWIALELSGGALAIIGGTDVFGHFLEHGYDVFHLTLVRNALLPGGRPVFPGVPMNTPQELLANHGLTSGPPHLLEATSGTTLVTWRR
jgi:dihydrofolate reductase